MIIKRAQRKTRREQRRFKKRTFISIVSIVAILGSFLYVMNHDYLAVHDISIDGQKTLIKEDISLKVNDYLREKFLGIIRKDNILLLSTLGIERRIKSNFPKIEEISVRVNEGDQLVITVGERSAHSLWCIDRPYESVFDEVCYFSDKEGLLYARAPYFSGSVYMKFFIKPEIVVNKDNEEVEMEYVGTHVNIVNSFTDFFNFLEKLENQSPIDIARISFDEFEDVIIELSRVKGVTYDNWQPLIRYNQSSSYEHILRNVDIVLNFEDFEEDFAYRPSALESIDVRFEDRVSYTFAPIGKKPGLELPQKNVELENDEIIETN